MGEWALPLMTHPPPWLLCRAALRCFVPCSSSLQDLGVASWPTWSHGVDSFPYVYGEDEDCFFLEGKVVVTPTGERA